MNGTMRRMVILAMIVATLVGVFVFLNAIKVVPVVGREVNRVRDLEAKQGSMSAQVANLGPVTTMNVPASEYTARSDWPGYNKVLTSEGFSGLTEINKTNFKSLHVVCIYETDQQTSFQSGLIMVNNAIIGTMEKDIFSIDADNCHENWRTHEAYEPVSPLSVNRGAAYLDGRLFRGSQDGRLLAYDATNGQKLSSTQLAYKEFGESTPSAPIAWNGMVFIGNAGGDGKGVKGRMYGLNAATGRIIWEYYMVPKALGDRVRGPQEANPPEASAWQLPKNQPILFAQQFHGAIGGGLITYRANTSQKVAFTTGFESILWATEQSTSKVVVLGL